MEDMVYILSLVPKGVTLDSDAILEGDMRPWTWACLFVCIMCVCMYVCVHIHTYIHMSTYICIHTYTHMHVDTYIQTHICIFVRGPVCVFICVYTGHFIAIFSCSTNAQKTVWRRLTSVSKRRPHHLQGLHVSPLANSLFISLSLTSVPWHAGVLHLWH